MLHARLLAALTCAVCATHAYAGAWTQEKGAGLLIGQVTYFSSDQYYDLDGTTIDQPSFRKYELQPYAEYGLKDWLTVGGSAYLQRVSQAGDDNYGLGDPELFARARLWQSADEVVAVQPLLKLPSYFGESGLPRGGSRSVDTELSLLYGRSGTQWGLPYYTDMRLGYRTRTRDLNPQWRVDVAMGVMLTEHWQIIPAFRSVVATKYNDNAPFREDGEQDYDLAKLELTSAYHFSDTQWLQATVFDHIAGAQTGAGRGFSLGIAQRF